MILRIFGVVQGVGFRPTVFRVAQLMGAKGYVKNKGSYVEVCVDKDEKAFIDKLKEELPVLGRIDRVEMTESDCHEEYDSFVILSSEEGEREVSIPPDVATCVHCLNEIFAPRNRRYLFPFTNCTDCGARFSLIEDFPYDRKYTSMSDFPLCGICNEEYGTPADWRFHAQTISCPDDGPAYVLYDSDGKVMEKESAIEVFASEIDAGGIGVAKSWGGMHIVCKLEAIPEFRKWYNRPFKPFAVMVRNLGTARKYAEVGEYEEQLLTSFQAPIVLLPKKEGPQREVLDPASPGLGNVGLYLPYTAMQHILFHHTRSDALVMTSANLPDEPMLTNNEDVFSLGLDLNLLHNRRIVSRVDDSILIPFEGRKLFIRKSRGFVPDLLNAFHDRSVLSVGPEENVTASMSKDGKLIASQYIGNTTRYEVQNFLRDTIDRLLGLFGIKEIDAVAIDPHPMYTTRRIGEEFAERFGSEIFEVQHHWAHVAGLMADNDWEQPLVSLSVDGAGYGLDEKIWGGEILYSQLDSFERLGHLEYLPMIGGDLATKEPKRMLFAIFQRLGVTKDYFEPHKSEVFIKAMEKSPQSCSLGRVLDALSSYLGICDLMTYDGEPAIKLERYLDVGKPQYEFHTEIEGSNPSVIRTLPLFETLDSLARGKNLTESEKADMSRSFVEELMKRMVEVCVHNAEERDLKTIGLTGGVSYNLPVVRIVKGLVENSKMDLLLHNSVPNGDGGISIGQNVIAGNLL
ncbi:MAG: carbamoyltransferase HypF [Methanomassiliicoccales archaeon]|nr:MAG: carbamoyltransferase HypF [Methanomassiliicoccales archaeon]